MKPFVSLVLVVASATVAAAQVVYNTSTGVFTCTGNPNGAYCGGESLITNIIWRCTNGVGQPGNCNDNLFDEFPLGLSYAPCWETSNASGDAACSKNCVVYGASGNFNGTFTLPDCTGVWSSTSSVSSTSTSSASSESSTTTKSSCIVSKSSKPPKSSEPSGNVTKTSTTYITTVITAYNTGSTTYTPTHTTRYSAPLKSSGSGSTGSLAPPSNGTISFGAAGGASSAESSPTATPVGPTASSSPTYTASAIANSAGSILAAVGLIVAYFL